MKNRYLYADRSSRDFLLNDLQKIFLIGGDTGNTNFGDVLQAINSINSAKQVGRFATVCVMVAHAISFKEFPDSTRNNYGADAIVFVADYPLILDDSSPCLELIGEIRNLAAVHLYGGGFLNNMWGDYLLGITEYFLQLAPDATYSASGQQVTHPYQSRVVEHIKEFTPKLFGVRDELGQRWLREAGFSADFSFDDATESLLELTETLPLQLGTGLLMHLNASDYTASIQRAVPLGKDLQQLKASRWGRDGATLIQAFRDPRDEVCDTRETIKKLDAAFPLFDLRLIELASLVYSGRPSNLIKPIMGDIGYSCSYHVALWLQLAGIPCWLRSSNPFYDQKAGALQVTQKLDSFLDEPRLADHRFNLERREAWNEKFRTFMLQIPEVSNTCAFTPDEKGPAPWPFFYKGKPTLQEKLVEVEKSDRWQRDRAENSVRDLGIARGELEQLHRRVEALTGQLTEVGNEAHQQRDRAERSERNLSIASGELDQLQRRVEALTEQVTEVGSQAHRHLFRAEGSERDLGIVRAALGQLHARVGALTEQLTEVGDQAHRQRDRAESSERDLGIARAEIDQLHDRIGILTGHLASIHHSRSWRLTRGLRVLGRVFRGEFGLVRDGLRRALRGKD